ncbi:MAG: SgcJ/EcaC family oxidoreductase, partial [Verrucomicrobia bacterium]|nr:SgcJ/EcaC family oxidoreductase [Verrucomicrobiota bacterium]
MRLPSLTAAFAILTAPLFAEQTDHSGWQYDAVLPEQLSDTASPTAADINAINDLLARMLKCWNTHDLPGYLSVYWNSPQLIVVVGNEQHQGWDALKAAYSKYYPEPDTMGSIEERRVQVRITKPDLALAETTWIVNYPNSKTQANGTSTLNLQKIDGNWKIVGSYVKYSYSTSRGWEYDSIQPEPIGGATQQQDEIKSINDLLLKMVDRWNAHDVDGYLSAYWNSPELLVIIQEEQYQGWQSLKAAYKSGYQDPNTMGFSHPSRIQIKLIKQDLAAAVTWWTVSYPTS